MEAIPSSIFTLTKAVSMHVGGGSWSYMSTALMAYNIRIPDTASSYQDSRDACIDLGLSLRTPFLSMYHDNQSSKVGWLQPESQYGASNAGHLMSHKKSKGEEEDDGDSEGAQSKDRCCYVKVNMDGVPYGRKIGVFEHTDYWSLALQLQAMFGKYFGSGIRLFDEASGLLLIYQSNEGGEWRSVGDCPWE
ncbi:hypothetical protein AMTR_s00044p00224480 [Amborella trichopoda]|uniref:Auxin-responsive protein n=1 Tax=Amborella trichopoda TaxID=13333 RepID=U5CVB8_AMBTC|nr:hypothetical protein AMTR_s00044p00224480 [Amborella trichopoda]